MTFLPVFHGDMGITSSVVPMYYPYLVGHAFDRRTGQFDPASIRLVLKEHAKILVKQYGVQLADQVIKNLDAATDIEQCPNGLFGFDGLETLKSLVDQNKIGKISIGLNRATFAAGRFGECLGLRPEDRQGEEHVKAKAIFDEMLQRSDRYIRPFIHRYGFSVRPHLTIRSHHRVLDMTQEIEAMRLYFPDINWQTEPLAKALREDFVGDDRDSVVLAGSYGDASIGLRVICDSEAAADPLWRRGFLDCVRGNEMVFINGYSGACQKLEYSVRTTLSQHRFEAGSDDGVDYWREQNLMADVARMLYVGLYQRCFQGIVDNNPHWNKFREKKVPTT